MKTNKEDSLKFSLEIEKLVKEKKLSYIDAIIYYCEQAKFEVELVSKLLSKNLKSKLKEEAEELNFLKKTKRLPV